MRSSDGLAPVHVGTSGWVYGHWWDAFYPRGLPPEGRLSYYAQLLTSVEVNNTYYRSPTENAIGGWLGSVPEDFTFAVKAHRAITHRKRLMDAAESVRFLLDRLAPFGERAPVVLFQLPPFFEEDAARLAAFLPLLPREGPHRFAFEFRHPSWHTREVYDLLAEHGVALCLHDLWGEPPPLERTADLAYVRFHGPDRPYEGRYEEAHLAAWADLLHRWRSERTEVFCYFNNDEAAYAVWNALELADVLAERAGAEAPRLTSRSQ